MSTRRRCVACGKLFGVQPQVPDQSYCAEAACQRERKRLWQKARRAADPDYKDNQSRAQAAWLQRNPDYWREYREAHPAYANQNRERARVRAREDRGGQPASHDARALAALLTSGLYHLKVLAVERFAKMDVSFIVELVPLPESTDS